MPYVMVTVALRWCRRWRSEEGRPREVLDGDEPVEGGVRAGARQLCALVRRVHRRQRRPRYDWSGFL